MHAKDNGQTCQLMVVGAGMAGMAATLFAARRGISTIQAGLTGETLYASGLFDLYGIAHGEARQLVDDPWQGLADLRRTHPDHPLARVAPDHIRQGMALLTDFLATAGYPYAGLLGWNFTKGSVSALTSDSRVVQHTAPVQPGNSGGPLTDERGLVVGVVAARLNDIAALQQ